MKQRLEPEQQSAVHISRSMNVDDAFILRGQLEGIEGVIAIAVDTAAPGEKARAMFRLSLVAFSPAEERYKAWLLRDKQEAKETARAQCTGAFSSGEPLSTVNARRRRNQKKGQGNG